jgi:MinD-like ATPase involved in chromosome partitioning or flagellar assembly
MTQVLLAAAAASLEPELVRSAPAAGLTVLRRCVDAADLLAAATVAPDASVVLAAGLDRLTADVVDDLSRRDRAVVGLAADPADAERLSALGVERIAFVEDTAAATWRAVVIALASGGSTSDAPTGVWSTGCWVGPEPAAEPVVTTRLARRDGVIVAVWGPQGAPGRTTVAVALADGLATADRAVCVVDADTYAPAVALALGMDDSVSDLVVACRCADSRTVGAAALATMARPVRGSLSAIGGLTGAARWEELRPASLDRLWAACRSAFAVTVVDVGFCLEHDVDAGPLGRPRNAATLTAVDAADLLVCVADASPLGAARLGAAWPALAPLAAGRPTLVVRNRARSSGREWERAMAACGVDAPVLDLPEDLAAASACWARGTTLAQAGRRSRLRRGVADLARTCEAAWTAA